MDILKIVSILEQYDPEVYDRLNTRRKAMREFAGMGKKIAAAAMPFAVASMFNKAYGQTTSNPVVDALQFALKAEYIEAEFYGQVANAISAGTLTGLPSDIAAGLKRIAYDEYLHVKAVKSTLEAAPLSARAEVPYKGMTKPTGADYGIDITGAGGAGNGPFAAALSNAAFALTAAHVFEDLGVRAYKGQAPVIKSAGAAGAAVLAAGLAIHAIEARHASFLRFAMAKVANASDLSTIRPWVTQDNTDVSDATVSAAVKPLYQGSTDSPSETNTNQGGVDVIAKSGVTSDQATQSFDEPLDKTTIVNFLTGVTNGVKVIY